ncbi:hypothetical protein H696_04180 [Fonticula alba]|uniref:Uncharacterized protein n=1 Tax=Fonticula alba TaxID=691883 RepID=A0A058Z6M1_FONAL|nr:hypothetical protein H696_04180 [Fonticula alba]KCV69771.1 hypothetical protein H696_04180 [Fonticula alba]|eukprot:XP_009496336.1 hypothetical protein H696_04180 [Fonticula alba]
MHPAHGGPKPGAARAPFLRPSGAGAVGHGPAGAGAAAGAGRPAAWWHGSTHTRAPDRPGLETSPGRRPVKVSWKGASKVEVFDQRDRVDLPPEYRQGPFFGPVPPRPG